MRAVRVRQPGGPEVIEFVETHDPAPSSGELLVSVALAGVNYVDTYFRSGVYPKAPPFGLGTEGIGTVIEVGPDVTGFAAGDRVAWCDAQNSYAELVAVPARRAVRVPDGIPDELAVGALLQGMTAHFLVDSTYPVAPGESILVHAAAGGVGLLLTQMAARRGARVIGTVSTEEKAELARGAGAAEVIRYDRSQDLAAEVHALTDGLGVPVVYDGVGRTTFNASLASLKKRGTMVLFGAASGPVPPLDPQWLNAGGSLYLTRPSLYHYIDTRAELDHHASAVFGAVLDGTLNIRVGHEYPLAEARRAHEDLQGRRTAGKLLLRV
ncbi:quinone oxidoreductase family protein [Streptomyces sp. NPDC088116]|uniref:quinone oxidoreductase family protein n=1 Tax=Streptomyces sp. NPDC088116 TaxID=3365825 RepID=UPI003823BEA4